MPKGTRNCIFFSQSLLAVLILAFAIVLLAGAAAGEGIILVDLGDDVITQEDSSLTFNSAVSYTGTLIPTYTWTFGDGTSSSLQRPSHTYTLAGNYTVTLTVTDPDGVTDADSIFVEVLNVRPIADAGGDKTVNEGTTVTFDASNSLDTPSDLPLLTYEWDFGDGSSTTASQNNKVVTHTYADAGVYITRLLVRDDDWTEANHVQLQSQLVTVSGAATGNGTVVFTYGSGSTGGSGNGTNSTGGGGNTTVADVFWDFGDGDYAEGNNVTHTYESDGLYIATLIITDAFGAMSVHNILVTVLNSPPTAEAGSDVTGVEDESLSFTGSGSDPGGGPLTYAWTFGDGGTATGASVSHAFTQSGTYTVTLTVTDSDGLAATDTCTATVSNVGPTAVITVGSGSEEGDIISFSGTSTTDTASDLPLLSYSWVFGDGGTASGSTTTHAYVDEGTYTTTLTVVDDDGASSVAYISLTIVNAAPVATITSASTGHADILPQDNVTFTGTGTDKGTSDTLTYKWEFGDGNTSTSASTVHAYSSPGNYTAKFTVTDNDGGTTTVTTVVWVKTLAAATSAGQDALEDAPASSFDKKQDQAFLSELFDDLLDAIATNNTNQIDSRIHVLEVQIENKVTDSDLKAELLDLLDNLDENT
jgi:PKD repeat protein